MPDFYLRSKKEGLPDLAIEVKTLERDYDRRADYETLPEVEEHHLSVKDFHFVLKLDLLAYKNPPPKKVRGVWYSLKEELDKYKEKWEYVLDRIIGIEKLLENEDEDIYVKDLTHEKKDELRKIIDDIKRQDKRFLEGPDNYFHSNYLCLDIHAEVCPKRVRDVKTTIQNSKEEGLKWRIKDFLKDYFSKELGILPQQVVVDGKSSENGFIFTILFVLYWKEEEGVEFYMKEIERYVKRSKGKFEHLRKVKSDKSDGRPHWELLLVKGETRIRDSFKSFIEKLDKELEKKGYDCLFYVKEPDSWFGIYHLIIRMDLGTGTSVGDDWKKQIGRIIKH
jgi:hypothetical protein